MAEVDSLLAAELPPTAYEEWQQRVESELGKAFAGSTPDGLPRQPLYHSADLRGDDASGFPGASPYVRGPYPVRRGWTVAQEVRCEEDLRELGEDLEIGMAWVDPRAPDLDALLAGIDFARVAIVLDAGTGDAAPSWVAEATRQGVAPKDLRGGFGVDPLGVVARRGRLPGSLDRAFELAGGLMAWCAKKAPDVRALLVDLSPYHDAGAGAVQELAILAASGVETLRRLGTGLDVGAVSRQLLFSVRVGGDFFLEIAKLRAARLVWSKVLGACGGSDEPLALHARTSAPSRTVRDPWGNLLRETTECFTAALGGAESVAAAPYDEPLGSPGENGRRIAANAQHVLREEAYLDRVLDPAGGSYYVERLTDELARAAWTLFQEIERRGGMAQCLLDGWIRERISETAEKRRRDVARRKTVLVGTSDFAHLAEKLPERRTRAEAEDSGPRRPPAGDARARLDELAGKTSDALVDAAVAAIRAGATRRELSEALWWGTEPTSVEALPLFRPAEPFEALRDASDHWVATHGRRPRVFLAKIGEPSDYRARAGFATGFFAAGGIEAVDRGGFPVGEDLARRLADAFAESEAELAVLCSTDEIYPDVVPGVASALRGHGVGSVIVAGSPGEYEASYREAGVDHFAYLGGDAVGVLEALWARLPGSRTASPTSVLS